MSRVSIRFYADLNELLPRDKRQRAFMLVCASFTMRFTSAATATAPTGRAHITGACAPSLMRSSKTRAMAQPLEQRRAPSAHAGRAVPAVTHGRDSHHWPNQP